MRKVSAIGAVLLWAAVVWAEDSQQLLSEAVSAHQQGHLEEAAAKYEKLLEIHPGIAEVRSNLGAVYAALGRFQEAIEEYSRALEIRPGLPGARLNLALAFYKSARLERASEELREVLQADPENEQALKLLADCYLALGEYHKVIELLEPLGPQAGQNRLLTYALGVAYIREGREREGQVLVDRLFGDGESAEALLLLAWAQMQANDFAEARDNLANAVRLQPDLPSLQRAYGLALMATGDQAGARRAFEAELKSNPNDFESNLHMALIYKQERAFAEAEKHLKRALPVRPGDLAARYQLATVLLATGRIEAARRELEAVVAEAPKFIEAHVSLATAYYRLKLKAEGDREREIVRRLQAERQAEQPGARKAQRLEAHGGDPTP